MANPTTAAEWRTAANNILLEIRANDIEIRSLRSTRTNLESQLKTFAANRDKYPVGSGTYNYWQQRVLTTGNQIVATDNVIGQVVTENLQFTQQYNAALQNATAAEQGVPNTNNVTSPANSNPGSSTQATAGTTTVPALSPSQQAFLDANQEPASGTIDSPANIVPSTLSPAQQAFLEANQADEGTVQSQRPLSQQEQSLLEANQDPQGEPISGPPIDEFEGLELAIATQENALKEPPILSDDEVDAYLSEQIPDQLGSPLEEPPIDEFEGLDLAIATQENALQEPPVLDDDEVYNYLNEVETPSYGEPPEIDVSQDAAENAKFNRQQESANPSLASRSSNPSATGSAKGLYGLRKKARKQATAQDNANYNLLKDWRVRLSLAEGAKYLYNADMPGILAPLRHTKGVIFPYTPTVTVNYTANYDPTELVHSNYKIYQYRSSAVDSISINGDFTAQDTYEANYMLAVIHFFRSITKMFYGQDTSPINGTPPPLCYLHGFGAFAFDKHPLVITNFTCTFPNDVDYIRATTHDQTAGVNTEQSNVPDNSSSPQSARMNASGVQPGGAAGPVSWSLPEQSSNNTGGSVDPTYVPTKMSIQLSASPIISRNDVSRRFSLRDYASGKLLRGSKVPDGGGIW